MTDESRAVPLRGFTGGLNNVSDISALDNAELSVLKNLEVEADGSLISRPPITLFRNPPVRPYKTGRTNYVTNSRFGATDGTVSTPEGDKPKVAGLIYAGDGLAWQDDAHATTAFSLKMTWPDTAYPSIYAFPASNFYPAV